MNRTLIKMVVILAVIVVLGTSISRLLKQNSLTLDEYAARNPDLAYPVSAGDAHSSGDGKKTPESGGAEDGKADEAGLAGDGMGGLGGAAGDGKDYDSGLAENGMAGPSGAAGADKAENGGAAGDSIAGAGGQAGADKVGIGGAAGDGEAGPGGAADKEKDDMDNPVLVGASLNVSVPEEDRDTYEEGFYYEPLSDNLRRYITGVTYPADREDLEINYEDLRYLHVLHYDFEGNPTEGELICNESIAQDLAEIFYELYLNEYRIEQIRLIDEYDGDDLASMEANNTSCFNYREVEGTSSLSKHALGLAIDINPLYNPYVTYDGKGGRRVSPEDGEQYADRSASFPYKIDEDDLCYKLFRQYGFTWGGNWNSSKDYQHFQKTK